MKQVEAFATLLSKSILWHGQAEIVFEKATHSFQADTLLSLSVREAVLQAKYAQADQAQRDAFANAVGSIFAAFEQCCVLHQQVQGDAEKKEQEGREEGGREG